MNAGWDAADAQDWLGHRDIASTMVYAAVTKRREARYEEAILSDELTANNARRRFYPKTSTQTHVRLASTA